MTQRKLLLINGLYSNGNIEGKAITAKEQELERNFDDAINVLYSGKSEKDIDIDENPFFQPAIDAQKKRELALGETKAESMSELADLDIDQQD